MPVQDFAALRPQLIARIKALQLPAGFIDIVEQWYWPMAQHIASQHQPMSGALLVSVNGAQGSGKTTLTSFLRLLLQAAWGLSTVDVSLDDFYLTRLERNSVAERVHPLLVTRGVPGTHDLNFASSTLAGLRHCSAQQPSIIPRFDKALDDRCAPQAWTRIAEPVDVILFEGWCNHAPLSTDADLSAPINTLEEREDSLGIWRHYVNEQLRRYHEQIFNQADLLIHLAIPGFEVVQGWRQLQEDKLAASIAGASRVMTAGQVQRFIQHYERITRDCLARLPALADVVLSINAEHNIDGLTIRSS
ncbi:MAG: D-glycerate 3-kinase [Candidatus Pseudothioglobus sp.]